MSLLVHRGGFADDRWRYPGQTVSSLGDVFEGHALDVNDIMSHYQSWSRAHVALRAANATRSATRVALIF
jgi:hypothetical protein